MKIGIRIIRNGEGYTATCPSLPGCKCRGKTKEEVQGKLDEAIKGYIASLDTCVPRDLVNEEVVVEV